MGGGLPVSGTGTHAGTAHVTRIGIVGLIKGDIRG